jgi:hypothetical protein
MPAGADMPAGAVTRAGAVTAGTANAAFENPADEPRFAGNALGSRSTYS